MSLVDGIKQLDEQRVCCRTGQWYKTLTDEDRQAFDDYIASGRSLSALHRVCVENGLTASFTPFRTHLRQHMETRELS